MASNYTGNPAGVQAPASAPGANVAPILSLAADSDGNTLANLYQAWKVCADYIAWLTRNAYLANAMFGDGSDGTAALNGTNTVTWASKVGSVYTQLRDCYIGTGGLTISAGSVLNTNGYRIFCRGTVTTTGGGEIRDRGVSGSGSTGGSMSTRPGSVPGGSNGGGGGTVGAGSNGAGRPYSILGAITNSGSGGAGSAGAGGTGGVASLPMGGNDVAGGAPFSGGLHNYTPHLFGYVSGCGLSTPFTGDQAYTTPIYAGLGGGGGGGGSGNGGGGGAGGGTIAIAAYSLVILNDSDINASGGNGGNAVGTNAGGGGGGSGGLVIIASVSMTVGGVSRMVNASTSCAGGLGGSGAGTGSNGTGGSTGVALYIPLA